MKTQHLEQKRAILVAKREQLLDRFSIAARNGKNTARTCSAIQQVNDFIATLERIQAENSGGVNLGPRRYAVSSLFLRDCHKALTVDENEHFFFVTGSEVEGVHVLDQQAEFAHQKRTRLSVVAEIPSTHNLLIKLEQFGHKFLAHFHSHPGYGWEATKPSGIDNDFQARLEKAGHVALMAVFSRDGYVRFVRLDDNFDLQIYGKGVETHAPDIYRITNID